MRPLLRLAWLTLLMPFGGCAADVDPVSLDEQSSALKYCGGGTYVEGIDVSHWQGTIDWPAVKASGREFAFMKASEGTGYVDDTFKSNWAKAKAAGLVRGAYHFHRTNADPVAQADHFIDTVGPLEAGDFPLMLDVEDANNPPSASSITDNVKKCLARIEERTGRVPIIYTGNWYWSGHMGNPTGFEKYPLWIAAYPSSWPSSSYCPTVPASWQKWKFWQYSSGANGVPPVPGVGQSCDRNLFDGSLADLMAFVGGAAGEYYKAGYVEQSWPLAADPAIELTVGETKTGFIKLKNEGTSVWKAGVVKLAPIPRDQASNLAADSWLSPTRVSSVTTDVKPGEVGQFAWDLKGSVPGDFSPYFSLVAEGVTWFADAPKGGGPPDEWIQVKVHVSPAPSGGGGAPGAGGGGGSPMMGGEAGQAGMPSSVGGAGGGAGAAAVAGMTGSPGGGSAGSVSGMAGASASAGKSGSAAAGKSAGGASSEGEAVSSDPVVERDDGSSDQGGSCAVGRQGGASGLALSLLAAAGCVVRRRRVRR